MSYGQVKAFIKLAVLIPLIFLLGGCWDRVELNNLALITAIAFDKAEDNQIQVTAQIIIPQNLPGGGGGGSGDGAVRPTIIRSEKGVDIADALSKLQRKFRGDNFGGNAKYLYTAKHSRRWASANISISWFAILNRERVPWCL
jgi:spore germination protein KC